MNKLFLIPILLFPLLLFPYFLHGQDEGSINVKPRIEKPHFSFLAFGPILSATGDYSKGFHFDLGYGKRLNRLLTFGVIGGYQQVNTPYNGFNDFYVTETDDPAYFGTSATTDGEPYDEYVEVGIDGGQLTAFYFGGFLRFNLIPLGFENKFLVYGFVQPSIAAMKRASLTRRNKRSVDYEVIETIIFDSKNSPDLKETTITCGGLTLGPGIEIFPLHKFSVCAQLSFTTLFNTGSKKLVPDFASFERNQQSLSNPSYPYTDSKRLFLMAFDIGVQYNF